MRPLALAAALLALAAPAGAQDWATAEVCAVDTAEIVEEAFPPPGLAALEQAAAQTANGTGRFWRIEAPSGAVSHLWGTLHSADPLILDLPQDVRDAIEAARLVAVEVNFVAPTREAYRDAQYPPARYNESGDPFAIESLGDGTIAGLDAEKSGWIRERAIELGWTEDADLILTPAGMAEMLLSDPCEDFAGGVIPVQDDYVQLLGRLSGAQILGLEKPDEFLEDLADDEETAAAIIAVYAAYLRPVTSNDERKTGFALYLQGRLGLMAASDAAYMDEVLGDGGAQALARTDAYLLAFRNERFLERLAPELDRGGAVVAIGAGHIPGERGLVELLRGAGYTVTRIPLPGEAE